MQDAFMYLQLSPTPKQVVQPKPSINQYLDSVSQRISKGNVQLRELLFLSA